MSFELEREKRPVNSGLFYVNVQKGPEPFVRGENSGKSFLFVIKLERGKL